MRRTIMRYVCLCITMVLGNISPRVKKRFPTLEHYVNAGLLNENERDIMQVLNEQFPKHAKHWWVKKFEIINNCNKSALRSDRIIKYKFIFNNRLPIVWAASIVTRARKEGRMRDDFAVKTILDELNKFRAKCGLLIHYDRISIPLVYTQVVTIAVYSYFLTCLVN